MSILTPYITSFYTTVSNSSPKTIVILPATVPSDESLLSSIESLQLYLQENGISTENYDEIQKSIMNISQMASEYGLTKYDLENDINTYLDSLKQNLSIEAEEDNISNVISSNISNIETEIESGQTPSINYSSLSSKVSSLSSTINSILSSFPFNSSGNSPLDKFTSFFVHGFEAGFNGSNIPPPSTSIETTSLIVTSDMYEISTSLENNLIRVNFAYFSTGSNVSTFACSFYLSVFSLIRLSSVAYKNVLDYPDVQVLANNVGYYSENLSDSQKWQIYLIWLYSFLAFGVSSQLGFDILKPFPGQRTGTANYMINRTYLEAVGNVSLPIQAAMKNSVQKCLLNVAVPGDWPNLMYSNHIRSGNYYGYLANSIISALSEK